MSRYALQPRKNTLPRRREALQRRDGWWIRECVLEVTHHHHEFCDDFGMLQLYDSGSRTGSLTATIVSEAPPRNPAAMLDQNVVFEWPDAQRYIAMRIVRVCRTSHCGVLTETEIEGVVLGIAEYGAHLTRQRASERAQLLLTDGAQR